VSDTTRQSLPLHVCIARLLRKEQDAEDGFMELFYRLLRRRLERQAGYGY